MKGAQIAGQLETVNQEVVDLVEGLPDNLWQRSTSEEGWPVGVTARHIALGHINVTEWLELIRAGEPVQPGDIHALNAEQAALGIVANQAEVAQMLRTEGATAADALRSLSDDDLAGEVDFGGTTLPRVALAEAAVRHAAGHLESIKETIAT